MVKPSKLPDKLAYLPVGKIPEKVTQTLLKDQNHVISFKYYREDLCEIDSLEKNTPKKCIHDLKKASQSLLGKLTEKGINRIKISNSGDYKKLFNKLTEEVHLYEHKIQGTARMFYFVSLHEFHIVAITNKHFETDKVRR